MILAICPYCNSGSNVLFKKHTDEISENNETSMSCYECSKTFKITVVNADTGVLKEECVDD